MLELGLMKTFCMMYSSDFVGDNDRSPYMSIKSRQAFTLLASVCSNWYFALTGWPQSPTPRWVAHQLKQQIERVFIYID